MTLAPFENVPNSPEIYHLVQKMIQDHLQNLLVAKSASKEYIKFLKHSKESPILLIKSHIETQWHHRMKRIEKLLKDHESICYLVYKSTAIAANLSMQHPFRLYILTVLKESLLHKYLLDAFKWFRRMYSYVQLFVQKTGATSQKYASLFPKSWQEMLREDRELIITMEGSKKLQGEISRSVQKALDSLSNHIDCLEKTNTEGNKNFVSKEAQSRIPASSIRVTRNPFHTRSSSTDNEESSRNQLRSNYNHNNHNNCNSSNNSINDAKFNEDFANRINVQNKHCKTMPEDQESFVNLSRKILSHHPAEMSIRYKEKPPSHSFDLMPTSYYFMHERYDPQQVNAFDLARHENFANYKTPYIRWSAPDRNFTGSEYRYNDHVVHFEERGKKEDYRARPHPPSEVYHIKKHFSTYDSSASPNKIVRKKTTSYGIPKRVQPVWM